MFRMMYKIYIIEKDNATQRVNNFNSLYQVSAYGLGRGRLNVAFGIMYIFLGLLIRDLLCMFTYIFTYFMYKFIYCDYEHRFSQSFHAISSDVLQSGF